MALYQGQMKLHPVSLNYIGYAADLEKPFLDFYNQNSLKHIRIALILGILIYGAFGILDAILLPDHKRLTWLIRYGVVCPATVVVISFSYYDAFQQIMQPILSFVIVMAGCGIIVMIVIAPPPVNYSYYAGLILIFLFGYTFMRLRFVWASLSGWILVILYEISATWLSQTPVPILVNNNFFFISANIIGMMACYSIEYHARRDFYLVTLLAEEQDKVKTVNFELEKRVSQRTRQLQEANESLELEISERKQAEQERIRLEGQLKQAEKMEAVGNLAAGVAHDLNNILNALTGYPDLLLMDLPKDSSMREPLKTIQNSGKRAAEVVQDLLTLSRRTIDDKKVVNLNRVLNDWLASPEFMVLRENHAHVEVRTQLADDLLHVLGSSTHLQKIFMNLIGNAFEANLVKGEIIVSTENRYLDSSLFGFETIKSGEYAVLSVKDTGVGIAEKDLAHIFEPFFTKKKLKLSSKGLGMAVVWSTVKELKGFTDVRSREGQGTVFDVYLPITRQKVNDEPRSVTLDDCKGSESVLVVDDVKEQRQLASAMLAKLGYDVDTVESGEAAVAFIKENPVDILVLDMIMEPGMDGLETYRRILEHRPGQPAVIASGYSETDRVRKVQKLGAGAYVKKPFTLEKIAIAIRRELDKKSDDR